MNMAETIPTHHSRSAQRLSLVILLTALNCLVPIAQSLTINDLPTCALPCATNATLAVHCTLNDTVCLCSHPDFTTSTVQCSNADGQCPIEDWASVSGVLAAICLNGPSLPLPSSSGSSPTGPSTSTSKGLGPGPIKPLPSTTSNAVPSPSPSSSSTPPSQSTVSVTAPRPSGSPLGSSSTTSAPSASTSTPTMTTNASSQSASSTTIVIQTVLVPPTSLASCATLAVGHRIVFMGVGIMIFVLPVGVGGWVWM